jgi:hypothetical protein
MFKTVRCLSLLLLNISRKTTAYYVNAVYKVPGKKKKAKKAPSSKKMPAAKKATAKKRKAKEPTKKPAAKVDPERVAKLEAAIASARSSSDGEVGANEMQEALAVGYSKFFILALAGAEEDEESENEVEDAKPAAKKTKKSAKKSA